MGIRARPVAAGGGQPGRQPVALWKAIRKWTRKTRGFVQVARKSFEWAIQRQSERKAAPTGLGLRPSGLHDGSQLREK
eukprot:7524558-Heterocapsa_arctica.AAC.1